MEILFNNVVQVPYKSPKVFISVFNKEGKLLREIGALNDINRYMAIGIPFKDTNNNYYIFLRTVGIVKKFNEYGDIIKEYNLEQIETIRKIRDDNQYNDPGIKGENLNFSWLFFNDVFFKDNRFFLLTDNHAVNDTKSLHIYTLDSELNVVDEIFSVFISDPGISSNYSNRPKFTILRNDEILITVPKQAEVIKLFK